MTPFLPAAQPSPAPPVPQFCSCGAVLDMEMEHDLGYCVDCAADIAQLHSTPQPPPRKVSA